MQEAGYSVRNVQKERGIYEKHRAVAKVSAASAVQVMGTYERGKLLMILAVITTCRRKPEMVERAIKSVIAQTYKDWDLVVVDDSPADYEYRDDVKKMVEGYADKDSRIRYVQHDRNYGAQRARNTALKIALNTDWGGGMSLLRFSMTMMNGCRRSSKNSLLNSMNAMKIQHLLYAAT